MTDLYLSLYERPDFLAAVAKLDWNRLKPCFLATFYALDKFEPLLAVAEPRQLMLDSGAYAAWNSGKTIDLDGLIAESVNPRWTEVAALDVIDSWQASVTNVETMARAGSPAFPTFHFGEPWEVLDLYCARWRKVGLGGIAKMRANNPAMLRWLDGCFRRRWPHRFHVFGRTSASVLNRLPFHSADSTSWNYLLVNQCMPQSMMTQVYGLKAGQLLSYVAEEVALYLEQERFLKYRWRREMAQLDALPS